VRELVWGFVDSSDNQGANDVHGETVTTATSISQTITDWVRESPGENIGPVWDQVTTLPSTELSDDVPSDNIISTVSPIVDLLKDVVTEHIEKVKVNILQTTTFPSEEIDEMSTVINEQSSEETFLRTTSTTTLSTITPPPPTTTTLRDDEVTWDYRLLGVDASFGIEDLHWSYFFLMGFACLALLVCMAQAFACLYTSLGRQNNDSSSQLREVLICKRKNKK